MKLRRCPPRKLFTWCPWSPPFFPDPATWPTSPWRHGPAYRRKTALPHLQRRLQFRHLRQWIQSPQMDIQQQVNTKKDIYLLPCIICRQISADVKMKNYKIKTSFVNSEWPKARFNIAGINFITLFRFSWKIVCNTLLYFIFQYVHFLGEIFIIDFIQT